MLALLLTPTASIIKGQGGDRAVAPNESDIGGKAEVRRQDIPLGKEERNVHVLPVEHAKPIDVD